MIKLSYTNKAYKDKEFLRLIEKRIKQKAKGINPNEEIIIEGSKRNFLITKHFLEIIFKEPKISSSKSEIKAYSFEEEASEAINTLSLGERPQKLNNLLSRVTEEDIEHLCRILDIDNKRPEINKFLEAMLKKHPDVAFGFAQALEKLK